MMNFYVLTLFPDFIRQAADTSILGRAQKKGSIAVHEVNIRDFSTDKNMRVDDYPYGGGAGMVIEAEPVYCAVKSVEEKIGKRARVVYLTPQAEVLTQTKVERLAQEENLILLCGHYEGIDDRVLQEVVTDYVSIGDYVLTGGELGALVVIDAVSRFVPGVLNNEESSQFESLQDNLLEYPHYTRPDVWRGQAVPEILLSGDHQKIEAWRYAQSVQRTKERRPDLLKKSLHVTGLSIGGEKTKQLAEELLARVTRYGVYGDYDRKKLQKTRRQMEADELLLLVCPEKTDDGEILFREQFRNLRGRGTKAVVLYLMHAEEKDKRTDKNHDTAVFLEERGFSVLREFCFYPEKNAHAEQREETLKQIALEIRMMLERPEAGTV